MSGQEQTFRGNNRKKESVILAIFLPVGIKLNLCNKYRNLFHNCPRGLNRENSKERRTLLQERLNELRNKTC